MKGKDIKEILKLILESNYIKDNEDYSFKNYCGFNRVEFECEITDNYKKKKEEAISQGLGTLH